MCEFTELSSGVVHSLVTSVYGHNTSIGMRARARACASACVCLWFVCGVCVCEFVCGVCVCVVYVVCVCVCVCGIHVVSVCVCVCVRFFSTQ